MLSGRYPSDDFADLRPRADLGPAEEHAHRAGRRQRVAVINGGTIPDRGLYGVFLAGERGPARASASSTKRWCSRAAWARRSCSARRRGGSKRSRTIACSCPPRPGSRARCRSGRRTPPGGPLELGRHIGELVRSAAADAAGGRHPAARRGITISIAQAAENLLRYLADQAAAIGAVPDDRTIVIERCRDELGDWRICVLVAVRRTRPCAVGDGGGRARARRDRARRRDDVDRRRVRGAVSGDGRRRPTRRC